MKIPAQHPRQLGFDALLASAESVNAARLQERECADLPGTMDEALPFYRDLIARHHAAMLAGDIEAVMRLRDEAHRLATKLNGYEPGILADEDSPGCVLDRITRAGPGTVPLWGQSGTFQITYDGMRVWIAMDGIFGIASFGAWMGFAAHALDFDKPFLSETGYRSFLGAGGGLQPGLTPDAFATSVIANHVRRELKGRLPRIRAEYHRTQDEQI